MLELVHTLGPDCLTAVALKPCLLDCYKGMLLVPGQSAGPSSARGGCQPQPDHTNSESRLGRLKLSSYRHAAIDVVGADNKPR